MNVIVINESTGKASIRARRVLSKYLPQLGSSTWSGPITKEGLNELYDSLKKSKISKNSAITCHAVVSRTKMELLWVLGAKHLFDEQGRYAFRTTKAKNTFEHMSCSDNDTQALLHAVLRLAALTHDLGKSSQAFQAKLRKGHGREALRHELLSFFMLVQSAIPKPEDISAFDEKKWFSLLVEEPSAICACVNEDTLLPSESPWLARMSNVLNSKNNEHRDNALVLGTPEIQDLFKHAPIFGVLVWLVLTHHKLPSPSTNECHESWSGHKYLHPEEKLQECLSYSITSTVPWQNHDWLSCVKTQASNVLAALHRFNPVAFGKDLPAYCAHVMRPLLILSDHVGSSAAEQSALKVSSDPKIVYANTYGEEHFADTLNTHLLKVSKFTRYFWNATKKLKKETPHARVTPSIKAVAEKSSRFEWQDQLRDVCSQDTNTPSFVAVIAETGSGKTLASAKILNGLQGHNIRANWALGLRSLTFQTGQEIVKSAGFSERDVLVAVGQPHSQRLNENVAETTNPPKDNEESVYVNPNSSPLIFGSESSYETDELLADPSFSVNDDHIEHYLDSLVGEKEKAILKKHWSSNTLALLSTPLLVCTVDHLIYSAAPIRGADTKLYLRHLHADLVLDEVDAYSPSDLQALGKLVYCAGVHRRNVILMSATVSPWIVNGLYKVWKQGVGAADCIQAREHKTRIVLGCNALSPEVFYEEGTLIENTKSLKIIETYTQTLVNVFDSRSNVKPPSKKLTTLSTSTTLEETYNIILEKAIHAHRIHGTKMLDHSRIQVSTGFVECSTAKNAARLGQHAVDYFLNMKDKNNPVVKILVYHSKYPRNYLAVIDEYLKQMCTRKNGNGHLGTPIFQTLLQDSEIKKRGLLVLVCTTTLLETGRDFDFDFGIVEPRSMRGLIQVIGRICRHRPMHETSEPNVFLLDKPLSSFLRSEEKWWARPGVQDILENCRLTSDVNNNKAMHGYLSNTLLATKKIGPPVRNRTTPHVSIIAKGAHETLPIPELMHNLDSRYCIQTVKKYEDNRMGYIEQAAQYFHLCHQGDDHGTVSLVQYFQGLYSLNEWHSRMYPFRGSKTAQVSFIPPENTGVLFSRTREHAYYFNEEERKYYKAPNINSVQFLDEARNVFLIPDLDAQAMKLLRKTFLDSWKVRDPAIIGVALRQEVSTASTKEADWSPWTGFIE